jgi:hypothetical protein
MAMRALAWLSLVVLLSGCGKAGSEAARQAPSVASEAGPALAMAERQPADTVAFATTPGESAPPAAGALERKIIYTATVDLVVEDFTPVPAQIDQLVKGYHGFIANSQVSGSAGERRRGEWTLRIPIANFEAFLRDAQGEVGEVRSVARDSKDVSEEFYDVEARIRNKRKEEERLLKLLEEKTGTLEEVLGIERELSRVREEIERFEGRMRVLADLTALTTITLRVEEVRHFVPEEATTFSDRIRRSFADSLWSMRTAGEEFVVAIAGAAPWIILFGAPLLIAYRWWRRRSRTQAP